MQAEKSNNAEKIFVETEESGEKEYSIPKMEKKIVHSSSE